MTEVIDLAARRSPAPEPARLSDRCEGLLTWARLQIEDLIPMTRPQRIAMAIIFEHVLDEIDTLDGNPSGGGGNAA